MSNVVDVKFLEAETTIDADFSESLEQVPSGEGEAAEIDEAELTAMLAEVLK